MYVYTMYCMYVCMYVRKCVYVCMYVCMYVMYVCYVCYVFTVMARVSARALINFMAPLPPALIRDRRLFETQRFLFSIDE